MSSFTALEDVTQWRVLIVDDEPDNLTLASEFLTFSGATVEVTERGARLLELVDEFHPTIVLLDLAMPAMDGWEIQRRLRTRSDLNHIPIIALTALAMPEDMERAKMAGFDGYITKPFRVGSLLRDIKAAVSAFIERHARQTQEATAVILERAPEEEEAKPAVVKQEEKLQTEKTEPAETD